MGVTFTTYCRRCAVEAPEMGDFGYVGAPALGRGRKKGGLTPFGVIHDGFAALRMITPELAAFRAFLDEHGAHPLVQASDLGEDLDRDESAPPPSRLKRFCHRARSVDGTYELACAQCAEAVRSAVSRIVPFEEFSPGAGEIERFRANVVRAGEDNFYKVGGFPYDDVPALDAFLKAHRAHDLRARIARAPRAAAPKSAASAPPKGPWTPPAWKAEDHEDHLGRVAAGTLSLLAGLWHVDPSRRIAACAAVGETGERGALGYLVALRDDEEPAVRAAAALAIGRLDDERAVRPLGVALLDEADEVREAARSALASRGADEADALAEARSLRGPYAVWSAREARTPATPQALEAALRDPEGAGMDERSAVVRKRREPWARDLLFVLAVDPSPWNREAAAKAIASIDDPRRGPALLALLDDRAPGAAAAAATALGEAGIAEAVPGLLRAVRRGDGELTEAAGKALARLRPPETRDALEEALAGAGSRARKAAADALGALGDRAAIPRLTALFADPSDEVRESAARAIARLGGSEASAALRGLLAGAGEKDRWFAAWALCDLVPEPGAVDALLGLLKDRDDTFRGWVMDGLAKLEDERVERALLAAAKRDALGVAVHAWRALIRAGDRGYEKDLVSAIGYDSSDEMTRDYLHCGNARLAKAARAARRGRRLPAAPKGGPPVRWGERRA
jgi:HEAT repeat protein